MWWVSPVSSATWFGKLTRRRPGYGRDRLGRRLFDRDPRLLDRKLACHGDVLLANTHRAVTGQDDEPVVAAQRAKVVGIEGDAAVYTSIPGDLAAEPSACRLYRHWLSRQ